MNARIEIDEELRDAEIAAAARRHVAAIRTNILAAHAQTLHDLGNDLGERLCDNATMATLIRSALSCGPLTAGQMLIDLIQKGIDADAENEAIKEVEHMEAARLESSLEARAEHRQWHREFPVAA